MASENDETTYGAAILLFEREHRKALDSGKRPDVARKAALIALLKSVRRTLAELETAFSLSNSKK